MLLFFTSSEVYKDDGDDDSDDSDPSEEKTPKPHPSSFLVSVFCVTNGFNRQVFG